MNLYSIVDNGIIRDWEGTQADAKRTAKEYDGEVVPFEVPTNKEDLLSFLKKYVVNMDEEGNHEEGGDQDAVADDEEEGEEDEEYEEDGASDEDDDDVNKADEDDADEGKIEEIDERVTNLEALVEEHTNDLAEMWKSIKALQAVKPAAPKSEPAMSEPRRTASASAPAPAMKRGVNTDDKAPKSRNPVKPQPAAGIGRRAGR